MLHNINDGAKKETSLTDKFANAEKLLKENIENSETQGAAAKTVAATLTVIAFPYLTVPVAVLSAVYAAGGIAYNLYTKHDELAIAEKNARLEKELHENEMQKYRNQPVKIYTNKIMMGFWSKNRPMQQDDGKGPANNAVYEDAAKKKKA